MLLSAARRCSSCLSCFFLFFLSFFFSFFFRFFFLFSHFLFLFISGFPFFSHMLIVLVPLGSIHAINPADYSATSRESKSSLSGVHFPPPPPSRAWVAMRARGTAACALYTCVCHAMIYIKGVDGLICYTADYLYLYTAFLPCLPACWCLLVPACA